MAGSNALTLGRYFAVFKKSGSTIIRADNCACHGLSGGKRNSTCSQYAFIDVIVQENCNPQYLMDILGGAKNYIYYQSNYLIIVLKTINNGNHERFQNHTQ
jgi:hypothetical protein